jgi:hypothetical protein
MGGRRVVIEVGSGGGYWTYLLRRYYCITVVAIDSAASVFRTTWISDTIIYDGLAFISKPPDSLTKNIPDVSIHTAILLLVYPQASGDFTKSILTAFDGSAIVVAGTQSGNGFTGFPKGETVENWIARNKADFELVARIPLPSFAGKVRRSFQLGGG